MAVAIQEAVTARPVGPLRRVVAKHHAYRQRGVAPGRHLGLPSPHLTTIFTVDEPLRIARHPDPTQSPGEYLAIVGGLHTSPAVIEHDGAESGIQVQLSPLGARTLFGLPAGELAGIDVSALELLGGAAGELQEQLRAASGWPSRFALLDQHLGRRLDSTSMPAPEVRRAWWLLRSSRGMASIASIARDVGWSERHLASQFRTEIGLAPKPAARVIRFDRARRMLLAASGADVAAVCGYSDQSHLVRDFTAFSGLSPRAWLRSEVGNVQRNSAAQHADLVS